MTISDLNNQLSGYIDLSESSEINVDLKTSIINQDFSDIFLVPSIQNIILLKNKYEVLEVKEDYLGELQELMRKQKKVIPSSIPFINVLLIGGGSSGEWIQKSRDDYISAGVSGEVKYQKIINISPKDTINIQIGKGGDRKDSQLFIYKGLSSDYPGDTTDTSINIGGNSTFSIGDNVIFTAYGGGQEENLTGLRSEYNKNEYKYICDDNIFKIENPVFKNLIFNSTNNCFISHLWKRVAGLELDIISSDYNSSRSWVDYLINLNKINKNNYNHIQSFLSTLKNNLKKIPESIDRSGISFPWPWYNYNEFGCYIDAGRDSEGKFLFFDGLDGSDPGSPGSPGDRVQFRRNDSFINAPSKTTRFFHRGEMGAGADGICYIYYPRGV